MPEQIRTFLRNQNLFLLSKFTWERKAITYPTSGLVRGDMDSGMANYKIITDQGYILIEVGKEFKTMRITENTLSTDF